MPNLTLHNNISRKKEAFQPLTPERVSVYVCGPTVYGAAHIGNARAAVVFDVLVRLLRQLYPQAQVVYARNITDIDDKINAKAAAEGVGIEVIAARYHAQYRTDMQALAVLPPDIEPMATAHITAIQSMIKTLLEKNHAYEAENHVLFDVSSDGDYGSLARRNAEDMQAGARVEVAPFKRNPSDFVLWKPSPPELVGWDSAWGRGRPGWHIECSAMIKEHLGTTIDIHGGGTDLQFPHHENEAAQSRCAHGAPLARFWLHNGMLTTSGEKMSKSQGNITLVKDLLGEYSGEVVRLALLQTQYRQALDFTPALLKQCQAMLNRLYHGVEGAEEESPSDAFMAALCDDLNTPQAMSVLFEDLKAGRVGAVLAAGRLLGILAGQPTTTRREDNGETTKRIELLITAREEARTAKDFTRADEIRAELEEMGVVLEDTASGTKWTLK